MAIKFRDKIQCIFLVCNTKFIIDVFRNFFTKIKISFYTSLFHIVYCGHIWYIKWTEIHIVVRTGKKGFSYFSRLYSSLVFCCSWSVYKDAKNVNISEVPSGSLLWVYSSLDQNIVDVAESAKSSYSFAISCWEVTESLTYLFSLQRST